MKIPPSINIMLLVLGTTAFYTVVGQLVPQKEVPAPQVIEISKDASTEEMIEIGKGIAQGKGLCLTCHTIGQSGALRFPDLGGIGMRAAGRIPGLSDVEYMAQSLYEPDVYVVEGFNPGMATINKAPIGLTDDEILTVIAFLQSLGGVPSVTMQTKHAYNGGGEVSSSTMTLASSEGPAGSASETQSLNGASLFESYKCSACHSLTPPTVEETAAVSSLHDVGARLDRGAIYAGILEPERLPQLSEDDGQKKKQAMREAGVYDKATLEEVQSIVDYLVSQRGAE